MKNKRKTKKKDYLIKLKINPVGRNMVQLYSHGTKTTKTTKTTEVNKRKQLLDDATPCVVEVAISEKEKHINTKVETYLDENLKNEMFKGLLTLLYTPHLVNKLFWAINLLVSYALISYLTFMAIHTYLEYGVHTTERTVFETPAVFPKVTVCNTNPFQTEYAVDFLREINDQVAPHTDMFNRTQLNAMNYTQKHTYLTSIYAAASAKMMSTLVTDDERKKLGHRLDDILMLCLFNGETCTPADFIWTFDPNYGNCYVFNSGFNASGDRVGLKQLTMGGLVFGLILQFYVGFNENLTMLNALSSKGAILRVENGSYLTDESLNDGIFVASGQFVDIIVNRHFEFMLPKPYSDCDLDNDNVESNKHTEYELVNLIAESQYEYKRDTCFMLCIQKKLIAYCNCTYPLYLSLFDAPQCQVNDCFRRVMANFFTHDYIQDNCVPLCPLECNRTELTFTFDQIKLLGEIYVDYIRENGNLSSDFVSGQIDDIAGQNSVSVVRVFYYSLSYMLTEEAAEMDIVALLATIGGNLGLFVGINLLSVCELVSCFIEIYYFKKAK